MGSLMLLLVASVGCLLTCSQSASVKTMKKEGFLFGKGLTPSNSESCYNTQPSGDIIPVTCNQPDATECAVLSYVVEETPPVPVHEYACATEGACKDPTNICEQVAQQLPYAISECTLKCCKGTNCNKPPSTRTLRASPLQLPTVDGLFLNPAMTSPENALSCYTTEPDQSVVAMTCPVSSANQCAIIQFDIEIGKAKLHEEAYACANKQLCGSPKILCDELAKDIPYPITNCVLKCCSGDNCNKPTFQPIVGGGQGHSIAPAVGSLMQLQGAMHSGFRRFYSPKNALSCYVTDPHSLQVTSQQCHFSQENRCGTASLDFVGPTGKAVHEVVYLCSFDKVCEEPDMFCKEIAKTVPFKMDYCTLKCCSGDNCNHP